MQIVSSINRFLSVTLPYVDSLPEKSEERLDLLQNYLEWLLDVRGLLDPHKDKEALALVTEAMLECMTRLNMVI